MSTSLKAVSILAGIMVGILVIVQFRTPSPAASSFPLDQIEAQNELIKTYVDEQTSLKSRIVTLREKIDTALEQNEQISQTTNLETLNMLKEEIGLTELKGPGFQIKINDSSLGDELGLVYAADIRDIVNLLRSLNVKGITINDQRVIAATPINSVGTTILVNNSHLAPPFIISAIGDYDSFVIRLQDTNALKDLKKRVNENGVEFNITQMPHIILPIYNGQFRLKYLTAIE